MKITFMGAGSTIFAKNVIGDCMLTEALRNAEFALYDILEDRLEESFIMVNALNQNINENRSKITKYLGEKNRKAALKDADFVINAIQVGFYEPCTVLDFEIPKKYGLRQTIGDTLGIGGIMRGLRTIHVLEDFVKDMEEVCPNAYFLNYTNPMAILTGYMTRYSKIKTVGLCHSVQVCSETLLNELDLQDKLEGRKELIAGINNMDWLLKIEDAKGNDLYTKIRKRAQEKLKNTTNFYDCVRLDYINRFNYYVTESSEHNAEYNMFYIKEKAPELITKYNIPLDEYPRRCREQIKNWNKQKEEILNTHKINHIRTKEYASYIMEAIVTNKEILINGNVLNKNHIIDNLPEDACVEVPCIVNSNGINPVYVGKLPIQCAAMNQTNINVQLLTIEAAIKRDKKLVYNAAMLDPHTGSELTLDNIVKMVDELMEAEKDYLKEYH